MRRRAVADALPRVLGARAGPDRAEPVGHAGALHGDREREVEAVPALELAGVVHRPDDRFDRNAAVADDQRVQRRGDVSRFQPVDEPLEVSGGLVLLVLAQPEAAVRREAALELGRLRRRRIGLIEVVVEHLDEERLVLGGRRRPEVVGVVVRRHEDALGIGGRRLCSGAQRQRRNDHDEPVLERRLTRVSGRRRSAAWRRRRTAAWPQMVCGDALQL